MKTSKPKVAQSANNENVVAALDRIDLNSAQINKDHGVVASEITALRDKLTAITDDYDEYQEATKRELDDIKRDMDAKIQALTVERNSLKDKLLRVRAKIDE